MSDSTSKLMRSSAVMATGTIASRITGIGRDITAAAALGFFLVSDAYSLGNSLPTIVYILIIGGALNAVFIPQLVRHMKDDADNGSAYADRLLTLAGLTLLLLSIAAVGLAPQLVDLFTPADYPQQEFDLAVAFARLCLPQIFFYGLYTMLSQVLNARGHFGMPMFAPIANNVIAIATFVLFIVVAGTSAAADGVLTTQQILILGIGTTLGVIAQAVILIPVLFRHGYRYRPRFDWRGAGLGRAGSLAMWTIALVLVNQATNIVVTRLAAQANVNAAAAGATAAGLTTYQKAHLVFLLPHSVITISIITAMLPGLSRLAHDGRFVDVGRQVSSTMRMVVAVIAPIAAILFVLGADIAVMLFGYGAATASQAQVMGQIVSVFMIGLIPFTLFYVLLRGFYAIEDTRTPFFITVGFSIAWMVMAIPLFSLVKDGGQQVASLALTYGLSYWIGMGAAWLYLARRLGGMRSGATLLALGRIVAAAVLALGGMILARVALGGVGYQAALESRGSVLLDIIVMSPVGVLVYLVAAWLLRVHELHAVTALVRARITRSR
ncbi:MAG: murein biosynthesis integral membrane protein MurJ [Candidatus Nanopelagicales bacterium]|nr:murein biosynthesis integral membrane protein MurJ [Candidatus Nanopelagicales bacterium]